MSRCPTDPSAGTVGSWVPGPPEGPGAWYGRSPAPGGRERVPEAEVGCEGQGFRRLLTGVPLPRCPRSRVSGASYWSAWGLPQTCPRELLLRPGKARRALGEGVLPECLLKLRSKTLGFHFPRKVFHSIDLP